jgi:hypothetical protein
MLAMQSLTSRDYLVINRVGMEEKEEVKVTLSV